ncbi:MAG: hypothetical protein ABSD41_12590 [Candidatus Bathyarchaeia archaeon]|jgi:hypothetical protein
MNRGNGNERKRLLNSKKDLAAASLYFYLGYYSGMRDSFNQLRSLNPIPREEPEEMRQLIEELPTEVAALRFGADPEPAIMKIRLLMQDSSCTTWNSG